MSQIEKAKLYHVAGPVDKPKQGKLAMEIQFNPNSLKVALSNSLKANERANSKKAAQYIEKSSSTLSVELIFDTTDQYQSRNKKNSKEQEEVRKDVRSKTGVIATEFMYSKKVGDDKIEAKRCMFAWGTFSFIGIMESFDETLEFFSPEGTPLRATVAIKLTESRFHFRSEEAKAAERDTPTMFGAPDRGDDPASSSEVEKPPAEANNDSVADANAKAGKDEKEWRDSAMFNGKESPRLPSSGSLSIPTASASANLKASASASLGGGISGGFGAGISAGAGLSGGLGAGLSGSVSGGLSGGVSGGLGGGISGGLSGGVSGGLDAGMSGGLNTSLGANASGSLGGGLSSSLNVTPPAFNFGASSSLGTGIPGAFSADFQSGGGLSAGSMQLHETASAQASASLSIGKDGVSTKSSSSSVGFD